MSESRKRLIIIALALIVGLSAGIGWGSLRVKGKEKLHQAELRKVNHRLSEVERQHSEDRSTRNALEEESSRTRTRLAELDAQSTGYKARAASMTAKNEELAADLAALRQKQKNTFQTLQEREKELRQTTQARQKVQAELRRVNQGYETCARHNARLCAIASELVARYEDKGPVDALLRKEPITQVRRVELENLAREYRDRIKAEKMQPMTEKGKP